jgi:hypothetical protein
MRKILAIYLPMVSVYPKPAKSNARGLERNLLNVTECDKSHEAGISKNGFVPPNLSHRKNLLDTKALA